MVDTSESLSSRFQRLVLGLRWSSLLLVFLGMLMVEQFFSQLGRGRFGADGYESYLRGLADTANIDRFSRSVLDAMADNASVLAPVTAVFVLTTGVLLMLLVARPVIGLAVSAFLWALWYATSATSGIWTFEYLFPAVFGLGAALATLPEFAAARSGRDRLLGPRVLGALPLVAWIAFGVGVSAVLGWFFTLSEAGGQADYRRVAVYSVVSFVVLLTALGLLERVRPASDVAPPGRSARLLDVAWVDVAIITVGAMMCIQVFADLQVGWYNTAGYEALTQQYADNTGAPGVWSDFLGFVADNAAFFWPVQAVAEFACAFFLVTLLLRPASLLATFGFFFTLMFSEFGVSATIKADGERTWEWEMLFVVGVSLMLAVITLARTLQLRGRRDRTLGDRFYLRAGLVGQLAAAVLGAAVLWGVGMQTKMFGGGYETISARGAAFFLGCLLVLAAVDHFRRPGSLDERAAAVWAR